MKVRIIYTESFEIDITPDEVAALLEPDADDAAISDALTAHIDSVVTEREWPAYRRELPDGLPDAIRAALKQAEADDADDLAEVVP
jgi:hypothetical protein